MSAVAVVVSATFWTWLWGPVGLILSMPLTLCLVVLGRHVPALEFHDILLGDEPALTAEEKFYQLMLAADSDAAAYQAEAFLKSGTLADYYDEVAVKGLRLAQLDVNRGELDHERRVLIKEAVDAVIDDLRRTMRRRRRKARPSRIPTPSLTACRREGLGSGCGALHRQAEDRYLDEAVAAMLAQLLSKLGIGARIVPNSAVSTPNLSQLETTGVRLVCLSYLEPGDFAQRALSSRAPAAPEAAERADCRWLLDAGRGGRDQPRNTTGNHRR